MEDSRKVEGGERGVYPGTQSRFRGCDAVSHTMSLIFFSQVSGVKQEESCLYLVLLEQTDFQVPQVSKDLKVCLKFSFTWR